MNEAGYKLKSITKKLDDIMKVGIALGSGGARGFAHIGILKILTKANIDCTVVTGSSIGALVGAAYAAGNLHLLEKAVHDISLADLPRLLSPTWSLSGFFSGKNALELLMNVIGVEKIEDLPKTFASVSTDLQTSSIIPCTNGDLRSALRSSMAIPAVFTPVTTASQILVDGGLLEPVPVEICKQLGADFVIAVDLFGETYCSLEPEETKTANTLWPSDIRTALQYLRSLPNRLCFMGLEPDKSSMAQPATNIISIIERTLAIAQRAITEARLSKNKPDVILKPPVSHVGLLDFHRSKPVIEIGEITALEKLEEIKLKLKNL